MSKSRRRQHGVHGLCSINSVGISTNIPKMNCVRSEDDKKNRQMFRRSVHEFVGPELSVVGPVEDKHAQVHGQDVDIPVTRFAVMVDKDRCRDEDVCFVSGSGRDKLHNESHIEALAEREHDVGSFEEGHDVGKNCVGKSWDEQIGSEDISNVGSEPSSSTTQRRGQQTRPPKKKRNKIPTV